MKGSHVLVFVGLTLQATTLGRAQEQVTVLSDPVTLSSTLTGAHADLAGIATLQGTDTPCIAQLPLTVEQSAALRSNPTTRALAH